MRIGLVTTEYPPFYGGGIGTYCGIFTQALVRAGHEVHVLLPGDVSGTVDGVTLHGFQQPTDAPGETFGPALREFGGDYERGFHLASRLREFVRETNVEIIESQDYLGLLYQFLYDRLWQPEPMTVPSVITLHGACRDLCESDGLPKYDAHSYLRWFMEDCAVQWADGLIAPSRWLGERTARRLALTPERMHVCPNPFDVHDRAPLDREPCEILFVGRLERRKGVEILTRALPQVFRALPACRIRFIGADWYDPGRGGSMRGWMQQQLSGWDDRLQFDGRQPPDRVQEALARATAMVIPSTWENFPNVCLEACAAGTPILASDGNGMSEIIDQRSGMFFTNGDADSLAARLIELLSLDRHMRDCLGRQGRERVRVLCDPDRVVESRVGYFRRVIERTRAGGRPKYPRHLLGRGDHPLRAGSTPTRLAVVVPCYNMGATVGETIDSLRRSTRPPDELVIVDDGSTDPHTLEVLGRIGSDARVVRSENRGLSAARNLGAASTTADTLMFLDADDLIHPEFIDTAWPVLARHPEVGVVMPWADTFGAVRASFCYPVPHVPLLLHQNLSTSSVGLMRRAAFDDVGGYKRAMTYGLEDWQFWIALLNAGWGALNLPLRMLHYRVRPKSMLQSMNGPGQAYLLEQLIALTPRPFREHFDECRLLAIEQQIGERPLVDLIQQIITVAGGAISIYGAGSGGRAVLDGLREYNVHVKQFVDRDEHRWGTRMASIPVRSLADAIAAGDTGFVLGSCLFANEMERTIQEAFAGRAERPVIFRWPPLFA
jgi:glycogen(starch) synthase